MQALKKMFLALYPDAQAALKDLEALLASHEDPEAQKKSRDWLQDPKTVGMMLYVDLYAGDLQGLIGKLDEIQALGVNLLHLMPLMQAREGENDGGFAVRDYAQVDERYGTQADFLALLAAAKQREIRICIDYVLNHSADDHAWAKAAKAGDPHYQGFYHIVRDEAEVKAREAELLEVFPRVAPGNFSFNDEMQAYVMTTFYPYQWDLNYAKPQLFLKMAAQLLDYGAMGIDMLRLDAIPYLWKEAGTDSRNRPKTHQILALFQALMDWAYPGVALLGEAIVDRRIIPSYFGSTDAPECHLLYHASYMVELWHALARGEAQYLTGLDQDEGRWIHYARCHDDIGWGLHEEALIKEGVSPASRKHWLMAFYAGELPQSFARGAYYEFDAERQDARNTGTLASLAGLEEALEEADARKQELSVRRILLLHLLILARRGIPMLYAGDDLGLLNNWSYLNDPTKAHDSRWLHRQTLPKGPLEEPHVSIYKKIQALIAWRRTSYAGGLASELLRADGAILEIRQVLRDGRHGLLYANLGAEAKTFAMEAEGWLPAYGAMWRDAEGQWQPLIGERSCEIAQG